MSEMNSLVSLSGIWLVTDITGYSLPKRISIQSQ